MERVEAGAVRRAEIRQIQLQGTGSAAGLEQFRDLRFTQPAGQADDPAIRLLDNPNPAFHGAWTVRKTGATRRACIYRVQLRPWRDLYRRTRVSWDRAHNML